MKITYVSCHSVLQKEEVPLLKSLGHEVTLVEPSSTDLGGADTADIVLVCHRSDWLSFHMQLFDQKKNIVWRSIGQSTPQLEEYLGRLRGDGRLKIIRYSPQEQYYTNYAGSDGLVRFSKDPEEWGGWVGDDLRVATFSNRILTRPKNCKWNYFEKVTSRFPRVLYGWGNEEVSNIPTRNIELHQLPYAMRQARVVFYMGTFPASYTLSFIEAMMTGVPIVSIGKNLFYEDFQYFGDVFEVPSILNKVVDFEEAARCSNKVEFLQEHIVSLLQHEKLAKFYSKAQRELAIRMFSPGVVGPQWNLVLEKCG